LLDEHHALDAYTGFDVVILCNLGAPLLLLGVEGVAWVVSNAPATQVVLGEFESGWLIAVGAKFNLLESAAADAEVGVELERDRAVHALPSWTKCKYSSVNATSVDGGFIDTVQGAQLVVGGVDVEGSGDMSTRPHTMSIEQELSGGQVVELGNEVGECIARNGIEESSFVAL